MDIIRQILLSFVAQIFSENREHSSLLQQEVDDALGNDSMQFKCLFFTITFFLHLLFSSFAQEPTLLQHGGGVRTVEFSPVDASLVASAGESNVIKLWNLRNNTVRTLKGHTAIVNSVAFSPNGELLASGSDDRTIKLWNVRNQQNIATFQHDNARIKSLTFSPDGHFLATGGDRHVKLWNVGDWTEIVTLRHEAWARALVFSPDGRFLAAGKGHEGPGIVTVWNVQTRQVVATLEGDSNRVRTLAFSPDNSILASSGRDRQLKLWNVSNWELLSTIPHAGEYDIAFSPDGKMLASTNNGYVSLWWVEDGARVARLPGPTDWRHPVDFSHDGNFLAIGAEDGIIRIWRIDISPVDGREEGAVQILHIDTYFQQLPKANSADGDNIPEPAPLPTIVSDFFQLDPFYEQWINVGGLPVIASAKVNPYAVKEAAWLIEKMVGHRPDLLRAMVENKVRFVVIGYTEMTTQIPEYSDYRPAFYYDRRVRGVAGHPAVSCTEENLLDYPGDTAPNGYQLVHEFSHIVHLTGLRIIDPGFDNRLRMMYDAAMKKGLWQGTYAASDRYEYWAEGTNTWIDTKGGSSFKSIHGGDGKTRADLKMYDPGLATLLTEVYGDGEWRYTPVATRTHLPHLRGFDPQNSPTFKWPEKVEKAYAQLRDPDIDGGDEWVNLKLYKPSQLSRLNKSRVRGTRTHVLFVNLAEIDVLVYQVHPDGVEAFIKRIYANRGLRHAEIFKPRVGDVYLVKDQKGRNLAVFRAEEKTGRVLIGTPPREIPEEQPSLTVDINADGRVNKVDLLRVVNALGKKATPKMRADVNTDGVVDVADLLLVIEHLDNPKDAAAPTSQENLVLLNPAVLSGHLSILHAQNDGTLRYQQAIDFLESLLGAACPERTLLHPNYPNPFNPETWIPYQLSEPAEVTLNIYSVNGTLVRTLVLGHQPAGMYHSRTRAVYWDGRNEHGERVASGVYFYTLSAGDFTSTRKMFIRK